MIDSSRRYYPRDDRATEREAQPPERRCEPGLGIAPWQPEAQEARIRLLATLITTLALGPLQSHQATVYSGPCDGQAPVMADGTRIAGDGQLYKHGRHVDEHALASTFLALGTRIRFTRRVFGSTDWTVRDTGGSFDLYRPNCNYSGWPGLSNPTLAFRVIER